MRPVDIVAAAISRITYAPAIFGSMEIAGLTELSPCWRPLLKALAEHTHPVDATKTTADGDELAAVHSFQVVAQRRFARLSFDGKNVRDCR